MRENGSINPQWHQFIRPIRFHPCPWVGKAISTTATSSWLYMATRQFICRLCSCSAPRHGSNMARSTLLPICILSLHTLLLDGNQRVSTFLNHGWHEVAQVISFNYAINFSLISHSHPCSAIICCNFSSFVNKAVQYPYVKHLPFLSA